MKKITLVLALTLTVALSFACTKKDETSSSTEVVTTDSTGTSTNTTNVTSTTTPASTDTATASTDTTGTPATGASATLDKGDREFVEKAGKGGMTEVAISTDALAKATDPDVKAFAQRMIDDHGKANNELMQFASSHGVTLPTEESGDARKMKESLAKLTGESFDKAYMNGMVEDHKKVADAFQKASGTVKDPDLKAWIDRTLPTVQDHLKVAQDLDAKLPRGKKK